MDNYSIFELDVKGGAGRDNNSLHYGSLEKRALSHEKLKTLPAEVG
jgi:hypothetical protein